MTLNKMLLATAAATGFVAVSAMSASAAVVCNDNVCWHTHETYTYPPDAHITVHEDSWKAPEKYTFREHEGRGYWHGDTWTTW